MVSGASRAELELLFAQVIKGSVNGGPLTVLFVVLHSDIYSYCVPPLVGFDGMLMNDTGDKGDFDEMWFEELS